MTILLWGLTTLVLIGCGTDDFLSRGEYDPFAGNNIFEGVGKLSKADFDKFVFPALSKCLGCHAHKEKFKDYQEILKYVVPGSLEQSPLYTKPLGGGHKKIMEADSDEALIIARWISGESFTVVEPIPPIEREPIEDIQLPSEQDFESVVLPALNKDCNMCHDNFAPDYESALGLIEVGVPTKSLLYTTAVGIEHGPIWRPDRPEAQALAKWIRLEEL